MIILDPGHGGVAPDGSSTPEGARGPGGALEKDLTLDVALRARDELQQVGRAVRLTRESDRNLRLRDRAEAARREGAEVFVSIHFNDSRDPAEQGSEVWIHELASPASRALGAALLERVVAATGHADRGVRPGPLSVLDPRAHDPATAACLVELSFLSDPGEATRLGGEFYRGTLAVAIAQGVQRYLAREVRSHHEVHRTFDIWHEVPLVPQLTGMSCWAAAAAMVVGWRDCLDVDPEEVAHGLGRWEAYRDGLDPQDIESLARSWELYIEPPRSYTVSALREVLEKSGPLWVGEASAGLHVVVIAGMHGDGSYDGTFMRIVDPWPEGRGERYTVSFREFLKNFEAVADLTGVRAQVLHAGGRAVGPSARSYRMEQSYEASFQSHG